MRVVCAIMALVVITGASATAQAVAAQEPGVFVDPGSPAGKEYAFPLDVQRAAAVGRDALRGVAQPRFGVGITRARSRVRASGPPTAASDGSRRSGASRRASRRRSAARVASSRKRAAQRAPDTAAIAALSRPPSVAFAVALATLAVVLGGLLIGAGIVLARRRRA